jgi:O-antigen/teichoic acid export membrane protein
MMPREIIKQIAKNEFSKNVLTMLTGIGTGQIITAAALLILTRLYTPAEFGILAMFTSIVNILSILATGRYDISMMLPPKQQQAYNLGLFAFLLTLITSFVLFIIIAFFRLPIAGFIGLTDKIYLLWLLPPAVLVVSSYQIINNWFNRNKEYRMLAVNRVIQNTATSSTNIAGGIAKLGAAGLIVSFLIGQVASLFFLIKRFFNKKKEYEGWYKPEIMKREAKANINFPLFLMPMGVLNAFSVDMLIYCLNILYTKSIVGLYSNANKAMNYPLSVITSAFSTVFFQKLSVSNNKLKLYVYSYFINLAISTIVFIPIIIWGREIFSFVLGSKWAIAGKMASLIVPLAVSSFAMRNVSSVFSITRKNHILLLWQVVYLGAGLAVVFLFHWKNINTLLVVYSLAGTFMYLLLAYSGFIVLKKDQGSKMSLDDDVDISL